MNNVISVKNLTKKYKNLTAIDNLSFDVYEGEILGLLGPNGSGKSTTINCLLSLLNFEHGIIKIFNKEMTSESYDIKKDIGVIFQEVAVFEELTVYENIDYFCGLYITDKKQRAEYIEDAIKLVGLEEFKKFYPKQLSGGLLRRLNIACGIAHKPKLIFLDGATILYTTHYMEEVELLCDRIIILDKGKIIAQGTTEELKDLAKIEEKITVEVENITDEAIEKIKEFKTVEEATLNKNILLITYKKGNNNLRKLIDFLEENKVTYNKIFSERPTLNDVFLELTGKELRD